MIYLVPPVTLKETKLVKIISQWYPSTHNLNPDFLCRNFTIDVICTSWKPWWIIFSLKKENFTVWISNLCGKEQLNLQACCKIWYLELFNRIIELRNRGLVEWWNILRHGMMECPLMQNAFLYETKLSRKEL